MALVLCHIKTECTLFVSLEYQQRKKKLLRKNMKKTMPRNSPNLVQDINLPSKEA